MPRETAMNVLQDPLGATIAPGALLDVPGTGQDTVPQVGALWVVPRIDGPIGPTMRSAVGGNQSRRQVSIPVEMVESGDEFPGGEVAAGAEDDEGTGRELAPGGVEPAEQEFIQLGRKVHGDEDGSGRPAVQKELVGLAAGCRRRLPGRGRRGSACSRREVG